MEVIAERSQSGAEHLPDEFNLSYRHFWHEANPHLITGDKFRVFTMLCQIG